MIDEQTHILTTVEREDTSRQNQVNTPGAEVAQADRASRHIDRNQDCANVESSLREARERMINVSRGTHNHWRTLKRSAQTISDTSGEDGE